LRKDFPILDQQVHGKPLIYFDNAATSQKPRSVIAALVHYYEHDNANVHRGIHELSNRATSAFEAARTRAAQFINARSADEIIFTRGTTEGINLVAATWGPKNLKAGDVIVLTELEHHSNLVPWQLLAQRTGAKLAFIPVTGDEGTLDLTKLDSLLTPKVKLLSLVHISNSMGTVNPVAEICARARKLGITTLVDGAQSAGHMPVDVQAIGCDFFAFSGHKICGPTGIGVLWGRQEILDAMPPYQGGGEMILSVAYEKSEYKPAPHRFEAGTPDISGPIGLHAAMDYLDAIGRENIWKHDQELASYACEKLAALPNIRLFGPKQNRAGLVSFLLKEVHAHDVVTLADQAGLALRGGHHCTQPLMHKLGVESTARASFYFYNTRAEVDRMIEVILEIQKFFAV
jgi:cysteine desulfurase/selenocysteine lyase